MRRSDRVCALTAHEADPRPPQYSVRGYQRLADKHGGHAGRLEPLGIVTGTNAALADHGSVGRNLLSQSKRVIDVDLKGMKIAIVDTDQPGADVDDT